MVPASQMWGFCFSFDNLEVWNLVGQMSIVTVSLWIMNNYDCRIFFTNQTLDSEMISRLILNEDNQMLPSCQCSQQSGSEELAKTQSVVLKYFIS